MNEAMQKKLLEMIGNMDKKDLEEGLNKVSNMLSQEDKKKILGALNNNVNKK